MSLFSDFWNRRVAFRDINMWIGGAVYGLAVYLVLVVLQPFGIGWMGGRRYFLLLPFLFVTWAGCVLPSYLLPLARRDFFCADKWTYGRLLVLTLSIVGFICLGNLACFVLILGAPLSAGLVWAACWQTVAIAALVFSIGLVLPERKKSPEKIARAYAKCQELAIKGSGKNGSFACQVSDLLFVESQKNYCSIVSAAGQSVIRSTISSIEEQLRPFAQIRRCHRAYLVNTDNIASINGNSTSGYKIIMRGGQHSVPIARAYVKEMLQIAS